ncbi:MAG TPA: RDD family protein [Micromonosporaceae bacterium]|nr:RDD family protein [Micromonosporaceae bacterium]
MSVEPGWYKDPADPSTQRYWDGEGWIGAPLPADATPPPGPPPAQSEPRPTAGPPPERRPPEPQPASPTGAPGAGPASSAGPVAGAGPAPGWTPPGYPYPLPAPRPHGLPLAPLGTRLAARLIDIGIVLALNAAVNGWFVVQWVQEVSPLFAEAWRRFLAGDPSTEGLAQPDPRSDYLLMAIVLITAALWLAYEVPAVANGGQTIGKRLAGVKVVPMADEDRVGFGRSLRRWNTLGLPVFLWYCCGIGFLLQLVDCGYVLADRPLRQALHDKRAQTVVVQVPRQPLTPAGRRGDQRAKTPGGSA